MADVKRYEKRVNPINGDVYMACVPDGAYVLYADYAALSQPVAEAVDIELQCPSCKSVEPYRLQIGGDAPAGVAFRTFPAPAAVAQPGDFTEGQSVTWRSVHGTTFDGTVTAIRRHGPTYNIQLDDGCIVTNAPAYCLTPRGTGEGA